MRDIPETQPEIPTSQQIINQLSTLGVNAAQQGFPEVARAAILRALQEERRPDVMANAANACRVCWRYDEAQALMSEVLAKAPSDGRFWATQGLIHLDLNRPVEAIDAFEKAFELGAPTEFSRIGRAMALLGAGRLEEGFQAYEARFELTRPAPKTMPRWKGESLKGKVLYVEAEQGLGDSIMFSRFLDRIQGNYIFSVQPQLQALFPQAKRLGEEVRADYWIPLMSLPTVVGSSLAYRPLPSPRVLPVLTDTPVNIGIFWRAKAAGTGGPQEMRHGEQKSCPMELFLDLATIPGVRLHSLQFGEDAKASWGIVNELPIHDFGDLAAYMAQLDLIVGIDSGPIHLAGMMNRPTILLLNRSGSWQWGVGDTTPWYDTISIIRQEKPGDWQPVMSKAKALVERMIGRVPE